MAINNDRITNVAFMANLRVFNTSYWNCGFKSNNNQIFNYYSYLNIKIYFSKDKSNR